MIKRLPSLISYAACLVILWLIFVVVRDNPSWPWYLTRTAGITSLILLVLIIVIGIGQVTGYTYRLFEPIMAWKIHRSLGIALCFSLFLHIGSLLLDKYQSFNLADVLVPFHSSFLSTTILGLSVGSFFLALGILAFYLLIPIIYTSLYSMERKPRQWKTLHYLSYLVAIFVPLHSLYVGTDMQNGTAKALYIGIGLVVTIAALMRLRRFKALRGLRKPIAP